MNINELLKGPVFFEQNRVGRVYTGGALFADFFGDNSTDGYKPEEWVASSVAANNKIKCGEKEGVSKVEGTNLYFDELIEKYKEQVIGNRNNFGVLVKVLDSAIRLPVQAHPDKAFSKKYFNSQFGKVESWLVLATRPGASIYFGFKDKITKEEFDKAVTQSETDKGTMEGLLNRVPVKAGDIYFVPAKMVHAIGTGCLMLEVQEPTDFTIQPEYWCGDYKLSEDEMYIGLIRDTAISVFDYDTFGEAAIKKGKKTPKVISEANGVKVESLISYDDTPCFGVTRYTVNNSKTILKDKPAIYIVTEGCGLLSSETTNRKIKKGDYFLLPASACKTEISADFIQFAACLPPKQ